MLCPLPLVTASEHRLATVAKGGRQAESQDVYGGCGSLWRTRPRQKWLIRRVLFALPQARNETL